MLGQEGSDMNATQNAIALRVAVVVWAGILAVLAGAAAAAPDVNGWKTYRNSKIGLEFRYPASYLLKELARPDGRPIAIGLRDAQSGPRDWLLWVRVEDLSEFTAVRPEDTAAVLRHTADLAQGQCAADGPESSVSCPDVLKKLRFTTAAGRVGLELYLKEVTELYGGEGEPDKTEIRTKGPVYGVDISTDSAARVLLFTAAEGAESREHLEILRAIVDTVRVAKVS
jgi:hypothetical protein